MTLRIMKFKIREEKKREECKRLKIRKGKVREDINNLKGYITFLLNKKKIWKMMVKGIWILSRMEGK